MQLDDESRWLWEDFRRAEAKPCCRLVMDMRVRGITHLIYYVLGMPIQSIEIKFCPRCGRKIDTEKLDR